ncbi:MAG: DUF4430 domain-containing protein [Proteobacteria bacterium]|jgi:hypothetical protein|nr:DUF4430 domain-containing protein [Pseudomonadota bacterium]
MDSATDVPDRICAYHEATDPWSDIVKRMVVLFCLALAGVTIVGCSTAPEAPAPAFLTTVDDGHLVQYHGNPGESALVTLQRFADVETRTLPFGEFVVAINGVVADGSDSFWAFYVNGEKSMVGARDVIAGPEDRFSWRLTPRQVP